ncbi:unnamed protein product [Kuraishia capsulata CBS 1993]|uniref:Phosphoglucomutase n=1 Tax=Kuraishia capsulata CBS 1993 TaxID=1382522 RepID=W6MGI8_9ASCO|nr:uncharacterized protein KUCA_T00000893001 [Kuraishia capsulata CBS 1993]CDK24926.1 unnamed protein product [Kuraishia capsulata CBS 1993]
MSLETLVEKWLDIDKNERTRAEIELLRREGKTDELLARLGSRILFGTAGLRARMEAGFSRMNDVTVIQASQGLAEYMLEESLSTGSPKVVIGHDHRHNSARFAKLTASIFLLKGFQVIFLGDGVVPTPFVPFAIDRCGAVGGVMVTASHNPAADNGYKVYWGNGCQITSPRDSQIQEQILKNLEPMEAVWDYDRVLETYADSVIYSREEIAKAYHKSLCKHLIKSKITSQFRAVYTPMHGVGLEQVLVAAGNLGCELEIVTQQAQPDPDFSTVKFPNPEEKNALDLAMETANLKGIDLVLANDPDADRFSAAVKVAGKWRQLTGNEIGFLFADYLASELSPEQLSRSYFLNSTVSSQMIKAVAAKNGCNYEDTLTGFKWIGNKAIDLEKSGYEVPFGFEEAIGFMFPPIHDKDGISALTVFLRMYDGWLQKGTNAIEVLQSGFEKYGFFKECNGYYVVPRLDSTEKIFNSTIRSSQKNGSYEFPHTIANYRVVAWRDLTLGFDSTTPDNVPVLPVDSSSQMITVVLEPTFGSGSIRFTARGSGTEPKLKVYIEATANSEAAASALAKDVWSVLRDSWFKPLEYNLKEVV